MGDSIRRVVVAIDDARDLDAMDFGLDIASCHRATIEVFCGVSRPWWTICFVPVDRAARVEAATREAEGLLRTAVAVVPEDVSVTTRLVEGSARASLIRRPGLRIGDVAVLRRDPGSHLVIRTIASRDWESD